MLVIPLKPSLYTKEPRFAYDFTVTLYVQIAKTFKVVIPM